MSIAQALRVMIVDDMSVSRGLIAQALEELGIRQIDWRADGKSAFQAVGETPVHLVISDYNMPEMNGLQLLEALRSYKQTQGIGFILITGRADQALIDNGRRLGMNNYLPKPFTTAQMKQCLEQVVGRL